jgi:hypothetical protein
VITEVETCEIRSGKNGILDCAKIAIGTWQFGTAADPYLEPLKICRWHANHFTRKGHWDVQVALKESVK